MRVAKGLLLLSCAVGLVQAETLTLPRKERPEWLRREGIVMAGSWEPLPFRVRRDGSEGYTPSPEQQSAYAREHSPEMVSELKALGVNSSALIVTYEPDINVINSARNLPRTKTLPATFLNVLDIISHQFLVMTVDAVRQVERIWSQQPVELSEDASL